jgi:hypothetical protein
LPSSWAPIRMVFGSVFRMYVARRIAESSGQKNGAMSAPFGVGPRWKRLFYDVVSVVLHCQQQAAQG